jgi:hypothetical protein
MAGDEAVIQITDGRLGIFQDDAVPPMHSWTGTEFAPEHSPIPPHSWAGGNPAQPSLFVRDAETLFAAGTAAPHLPEDETPTERAAKMLRPHPALLLARKRIRVVWTADDTMTESDLKTADEDTSERITKRPRRPQTRSTGGRIGYTSESPERDRSESPSWQAVQNRLGDRVYTCTVEGCAKHFTKKYNLIAHARMHTGEEPFACSACGKTFKWKSSQAFHEQNVHVRR